MTDPFAQPSPHPGAAQPVWSPLDDYLWHTCDILADVLEGQVARRPVVATTTRLHQGERTLAVGPGQRMTWRPLGNGEYVQSDLIVFGSPAVVIGSLVGSALGNAARRNQAARDAQPRWVLDGPGEVTLTLHRLHFAHPAELNVSWQALTSIDLVAPDVFQTTFLNHHGAQSTVRIQTPWASLAFALAAVIAFPTHPRLLNRGWLPHDFEQRCALAGRPCRPAAHLALRSRDT
ncbi:hypothetical protein AB0O01_27480 [Streptomyces sp. NPDC093252]|uniref:hypothetical protein n=1 Tax=Streptomyces sp. NPDC093252 TaxID=3154980 RepID=UPI0034316D8B